MPLRHSSAKCALGEGGLLRTKTRMNDELQNRTDSPQIPGRRWYRYPVDLSLRVRVPTSSGFEYMLAHGRDVSQGGMAVYVPTELNIGDTVLLELILPGLPEPLTLSANLKNRTGFKYGVEFVEPTADQQATILGKVHRLLAAQLSRSASNESSS
jgi:PilZ domain